MGSSPQTSLKIPLIIVIVGLIGYVVTSYYHQQQEFTAIRNDLEGARTSLSENLNILTQQSEQRFSSLQKMTQEFEQVQQRLSSLEQSTQTDKTEHSQLLFAQQQSLNLVKDEQAAVRKNLSAIDLGIKEVKEVQAQMIPTTLETRRLQQQIESLRQQLDSQSSRLSNLQEQISVRGSLGSETKSPNPLRAPMP